MFDHDTAPFDVLICFKKVHYEVKPASCLSFLTRAYMDWEVLIVKRGEIRKSQDRTRRELCQQDDTQDGKSTVSLSLSAGTLPTRVRTWLCN